MNSNYATQRATLTANADEVRTEDLHGREHVVAPVTLVREMVLKGEFLPFDEIEATQLAWNAKPGTITHPTNESGDFVPASAPDTFESHRAATLFGVETAATTNSLDGEVWIDRELSTSVADDLDRDDPAELLLDGETVEVSVGYWYQRFEADGEHDGESFDAVQVGIQPDHLALLPNAEGECSIEDGCGAGRDDAAGAAMRAPLSALKRGAERLGVSFGAACAECSGACTCDETGESTDDQSAANTDMSNDKIERLAEQSAFDAETLEEWDEDDLDALEESLADDDGDTDTDTATNDGGDGDGVDMESLKEDLREDLREDIAAEVRADMQADDREELVSQIAAQTGDDPEEYEDWSFEQLEKFAETVTPQDGVYAGRAGAAGSTENFDDVELTGISQAFGDAGEEAD